MKRKLRRKQPGQSIVLIALIIAVLIGLVALSVDVGNAYAQQRAAQRAANAASLDGMKMVTQNATQREVLETVKNSLAGNKIRFDPGQVNDANAVAAPGQRKVMVWLISGDSTQQRILLSDTDVPVPNNISYLMVDLDGSEDTTFATLFGRNDLPVVADAYARRTFCAPLPIGIDQNAFLNPTFGQDPLGFDRTYSDDTYQNKQWRRIFLRDEPSANGGANGNGVDRGQGQWTWLRWNGSNAGGGGQGQYTYNAIREPENIVYEEDSWPNGSQGNAEPAFTNKPNPYPPEPGIISVYDVVRGQVVLDFDNQAYSSIDGQPGIYSRNGNRPNPPDAEVADALRWVIDNRILVNLPIYGQKTNAFGRGSGYQIVGFEGFLLTGYGYIDEPTAGGSRNTSRGSGWYIDFVKVDQVAQCVQNITQGFLDNPVKLAGTTEVLPKYARGASAMRDPLDMVIVLDASGSMNWEWDGYGNLGAGSSGDIRNFSQPPNTTGAPIHCSDPDVLGLPVGCQSADAWSNYQERRLYKAKQAIREFIMGFNFLPNDRAAIITYNGQLSSGELSEGDSGLSQEALNALTKVYGENNGLTDKIKNVPNSLVDQLMTKAATRYPDDADPSKLYTTIGGSPGALGLRRSGEVIRNGASGQRERVVIFFTDGLLNVNLRGIRSSVETVGANIGASWKPINQAIVEAEALRSDANKPIKIYVIAMGDGYADNGLRELSGGGDPPFFQTARDENLLPTLLSNIGSDIINGNCEPRDETGGWRAPQLDRVVNADGSPATQVGTVTVRDSSNNLVGVYPIKDGGAWEVPSLLPRQAYSLSFAVQFYVGLDEARRSYGMIDPSGNVGFINPITAPAQEIVISIPERGLGYTLSLPDPIRLRLTGDVCVATTPPAN